MITQQWIQTAPLQDTGTRQLLAALRPCSTALPLCVIGETKISNPTEPSPSAFSLPVGQKGFKPHELTKMLWFYNAFAEEQEW